MRKDVPNIPYVAEAQENDFTQGCLGKFVFKWFSGSVVESLKSSRLDRHVD